MIVNRYGGKTNINLGEDPLYLYIAWQCAGLVKKIVDAEKNQRIEKWFSDKQEYHRVKKVTDSYMQDYYDKGKEPLFSSIELEIINRCNGECPFCPVNKYDDPRKLKKMDEKLFFKIIDELSELGYKGRLALHSNNEPFLDSRIIDFAKYARERLPYAFIYMYTNGTLVTLDKFIKIIPYLNRMVIDNYDDNLKLHENAESINKYCKEHRELDRKVEIHVRKVHEVLKTRGGQSPNNKKKNTLKMSCILPFKQMVIRPDGKTSLCCNDPYGKYTMADLNKVTLQEAWYSTRYEQVRKGLRKGRKKIRLCKYCDTLPNPKGY